MPTKATTDEDLLARMDESYADDLLTANYSAEEIIAGIRAEGGDPAGIGQRGAMLARALLDKRRLAWQESARQYHTLCFERTHCVCDAHGTFFAALLPGEKPWCPSCVQAWLDEMRAVLFRILARALAYLHRELMDAEGRALRFGRVTDSVLYPGAEWTVLGENPSWNPPKE